jgi:hypothetical protein
MKLIILSSQLNVPATFMLVALDEGPGPPIKYQYPELTKLHHVVSQLIRCCDVSSKTQSSQSQQVGYQHTCGMMSYWSDCILSLTFNPFKRSGNYMYHLL